MKDDAQILTIEPVVIDSWTWLMIVARHFVDWVAQRNAFANGDNVPD